MENRQDLLIHGILDAVQMHNREGNDLNLLLEILPKKMRKIAMALKQHESYDYPFLVPCMLSAIATCIGSSHVLKVSTERLEHAILFFCLVARKGSGKSAPLKYAFKHIKKYDSILRMKCDEEQKEYEKYTKIPLKQRENLYKNDAIPHSPLSKRIITSDITQETLIKLLSHNPFGICLYMDELEAWVKNFTRYNKSSSEEQFWLQLFNGNFILSDRKEISNSYSVSSPNINVIGGIHPELLTNFAAGDRIHNGFIDRIMFILIENAKAKRMSETSLPEEINREWEEINTKMIEEIVKPWSEKPTSPIILNLSPDAKSEYIKWNNYNADKQDEEEDDDIAGMYAKLDYYVLRLSLVLQIARWACGEADKLFVDIISMKSAIKLIEYIRRNGIRVREIINMAGMDERKRKWLIELPETFTSIEAVNLAKQFDISRASTFRHLSDTKLFVKCEHGSYRKKILTSN